MNPHHKRMMDMEDSMSEKAGRIEDLELTVTEHETEIVDLTDEKGRLMDALEVLIVEFALAVGRTDTTNKAYQDGKNLLTELKEAVSNG